MIEINLSERDFDYEIQALVNSFFPGQKSVVTASGEERKDGGYSEDIEEIIFLFRSFNIPMSSASTYRH